jgi:outer membrane protein OmpA-like peptidoglycan-associated protein
MNVKSLLLGTALALSASAAQASHFNGWYFSLEGGANWVEDTNVDGGVSFPDITNIEFEDGYGVLGAVGYGWASNWRVEFELGYRQNDVECFVYSSFVCGDYGDDEGEIWQFTQFVNVRYDVPMGQRWYLGLGAGIGGMLVSYEDEDGYHDDDYVLAGQLIGQLGYHLSSRWDLFVDYRYVVTDDPEFKNLYFIDDKYDVATIEKTDHTLLIGLRFDLQPDAGPPPEPPKPPEPPPEPPREFIVFFGFNKFNLTSDAQTVVSEAAAAAAQFHATQVVVIGHTDTVGSPKYNDGLSSRRSDTVRDELVRLGVNAEIISTEGRGESENMVTTGDGVKEPQNRRATITIVIKAATN